MEKYIMISNDIRNKILKGTYQAGQQLPFEKELGAIYDASKMTVKKGLDLLVSEGLIIKRRGSGTFVKDLSQEEIERVSIANQFRGTTARNPDKSVTSKVLNFSVIKPPQLVRQKLNLEEDGFVYDIYRIRYVDGAPRVIEKTYMPISHTFGLKLKHVEQSIYEYIEGELGLKIQSAHRKLTVRKATEEEAEYLKLQAGDPVGIAEQIAYYDTGTAFEYSISIHRYDDFSVEMVLTRN
ncbi:GntR family transcriptional regulator [Bavariicoccus seileri]|uniref:GntR family transcriptional regulator n=1 Tax=Bavariicoccus seileri TaxID=549685 RepID=UPI003F937454